MASRREAAMCNPKELERGRPGLRIARAASDPTIVDTRVRVRHQTPRRAALGACGQAIRLRRNAAQVILALETVSVPVARDLQGANGQTCSRRCARPNKRKEDEQPESGDHPMARLQRPKPGHASKHQHGEACGSAVPCDLRIACVLKFAERLIERRPFASAKPRVTKPPHMVIRLTASHGLTLTVSPATRSPSPASPRSPS